MTTAQPGQEQRMENAREMHWPHCGVHGDGPCDADCLNHDTRPTADLGDDGDDLIVRLRAHAENFDAEGLEGFAAQCGEAADRLILYREALEAAYREGWIDGYHNGRGRSVIDPGPDWLESDARAVLFRSGG